MHTYQSWLYKNYQKPLTESDTNGLIVAFDPSRKNAILHQQVTALQERTQFDRRVIAKVDTYTTLLTIAEQAWHEGYEHLAVLTSADRLSEVDRFLQERCGQAFESIQVVPESSPRLYEAPQAQTAQPQQAQQTPPQKSKKATTLFLVQLNPPLTGMKGTLAAGFQTLNQLRATNAIYAFHNTGIPNGYALGTRTRDVLLRGDNRGDMPSLYGKEGVNEIDDPLKMNTRSSIYLGEISDLSASFLKVAPELEIQAVVVPQDMYNILVQRLGSFPQDRLIPVKTDSDTFSNEHKGTIDLGRKITKESPLNKESDSKKELKNISLEDPRHRLAIYMLNACTLSASMSGEKLDKELALSWGKLDAGTKEFLDELGTATGVGEIVSGIKDIAQTVGSVVKQKEVDKGEAAKAFFRQIEAMPFDVVEAMNHPEYEKFVQQLDLV